MLPILVALSLLLSSQAVAQAGTQAPPPTPIKFIDMDTAYLSGSRAGPVALYVDSRQRAKFDRLLRLKHAVLPQLLATATEPSLR